MRPETIRSALTCSDAATLSFVLANAPLTVVYRRFYALAFEFPEEILKALARLRPQARPVVANWESARDLKLPLEHGELGVFTRGHFVGRIHPDEPESERYARIWDDRKAAAHHTRVMREVLALIDRAATFGPAPKPSNDNPFTVLGISEDASFADAEAARKRLAREVHPDRARASLGPRGLRLLEDELTKINVALDTIRALRAGR